MRLPEVPSAEHLPDRLLDMLRASSTGLVATTNPDGSPQLTEVWLDTDGKHVLINTVSGLGAVEHIERVSHKYTGGPYPNYSGRPQVRVLLTVRVDRIVHAPWH
jgi:hypothetical protein